MVAQNISTARLLPVAWLSVALVLSGCGRVGDPLPPFIRIPETASDFRVSQVADTLRFDWTNPARNVDQSTATGLERVRVRSGDAVVAELPATGPGEPQSVEVAAGDWVGRSFEFSVEFETVEGLTSARSAPAAIEVVEVPGAGAPPRAVVDQGRVRLEWAAPAHNADLLGGYRVYRADALLTPDPLQAPALDDRAFTEGESYSYRVVPVRTDSLVEGHAYPVVDVVAVDRTPPSAPAGLELVAFDGGVFVVWDESPELDVARYRVYRRRGPAGDFDPIDQERQTTTAFTDGAYQPGTQYAVSAVDRSGNEGATADPVSLP